jgi:arylformamidase
MLSRRITDWDDAYANFPNIPSSERWPQAWADAARAYREERRAAGRVELGLAYGEGERNRYDLFLPDGEPLGLVVFVHGGYWMRFDRDLWSNLARGAVLRGHAVALPSYTLCPQIRIAGIVDEIGRAVEAAAHHISGPIRLAGHSAGGHLATRMVATTSPLPEAVAARIVNTLSISGVHDLRPLMSTALNETLRLDAAEAQAQSPALLAPRAGTRLTCWVGGGERAEFIRQNALLANVWTGLGAATCCIEEADRHHFNVVDGLSDPDAPITRALLDG